MPNPNEPIEEKNDPSPEPKPDPATDPAPEPEPEPKDPHGQPGIARGKYERDIKERDQKIAELEKRIAEAAKSEEAAKELRGEIDKLKADMKAKDTENALRMRGCKSVKAAMVLLDDYDGDIEKMAEDCPFLFDTEPAKPTGSTGIKPAGTVDDAAERLAKARKLAGVITK